MRRSTASFVDRAGPPVSAGCPMDAMETLLTGLLRGEGPPAELAEPAAEAAFLEASRAHGLQPLLSHALHKCGTLAQWPVRLRRRLDRAAVVAGAVAELQRQATGCVLRALDQAAVRPLVIKGGHLAYTHYPEASLRPRADTDLLIPCEEVPTARRVLESLGYRPAMHATGVTVTHQCPYTRTDRFGVHHMFDLHWKIAEPHMFADLLTVEEINRQAVDLAGFDAPARAPSDLHALVIACVHRVAHHNGSRRLLWLQDVHRLVERMDQTRLASFRQLCVDRRIAAVAADGLLRARTAFGTVLPPWLQPEAPAHVPEASAAFLGGRLRPVDVLRSDLVTLQGWAPRLRLLREHVLPGTDYMRRRYQLRSPVLLPAAYAHRVARGARRWFHLIES